MYQIRQLLGEDMNSRLCYDHHEYGIGHLNATGLDQVRLGVYFEALNDLPYTWTTETNSI